MFAHSLSASLPHGLSSHLFGRFIPSSSRTAAGAGIENSALTSQVTVHDEEDDMPDLAQRVREIGEW